MKCPTCGSNLQIEDEKCPFCGNPNPFAVKHQEDMRHYQSEFQKTKSEVVQKTNRFTSVTVKITIIAVLIALIAVTSYMGRDVAYMIRKYRVEKDIADNWQEYSARMDAYELAGDWIGLDTFYRKKSLGQSDISREYRIIDHAASQYGHVIKNIMFHNEESPYTNSEKISVTVADCLDNFYQTVERTGSYSEEYYDDAYTPKHQEALARIREDVDAILITYCHLTEEEVSALPDYSEEKKASLIKEGLLRGEDAGDAKESQGGTDNAESTF